MDTFKTKTSVIQSFFAAIVIPLCIAVCYLIFFLILGNPANFEGNDPAGHPLPGNFLGIIYKGGLIVPILMSFFLMVVVFGLERIIAISRAHGKTSLSLFVPEIKMLIARDQLAAAIIKCSRQEGVVGSAIHHLLARYGEIAHDPELRKGEKALLLEKETEDAISKELPVLEKNMGILTTLASISTLVGLLGTVIGMVKAFAALATAGTPDANALANGISEALINTALGIGSSAMAIVAYNYLSGKIENLTFDIEDIGTAINQTITTKQQKEAAPVLN